MSGSVQAQGARATESAITQDGRLLTRIADVRRLSVAEAERNHPVQVEGVATFASNGIFLQQGMEAIYVISARTADGGAGVRAGQRLQIKGRVEPGFFARQIRATHITILGEGAMLTPRAVSYGELAAGVGHCEWVELRGLVRAIGFVPPNQRLQVELMVEGHRLLALVLDPGEEDTSRLLDAVVRIRGAVGGRFNLERQLVKPVLYLNTLDEIVIESPPESDPYAAPAMSIAQLQRFLPEAAVGRRVKVGGRVLWQQPGHAVYIGDDTGSLQIASQQPTTLEAGDVIEVLGFPSMGLVRPQLDDGAFRRVDSGVPLQPRLAAMDDIMLGRHEASLVRTEAKLLAQLSGGNRCEYLLQAGGVVFQANLELHPFMRAPELANGSRLRLTGICTAVEAGPYDSAPWRSAILTKETGVHLHSQPPWPSAIVPHSVRLLLRSPDDIEVVELPPWWTVARMAWALAASILAGAGITGWTVARSRRRSRQQARARAEAEAQFAAVLAERNRIARELHDSVQQNLMGIGLQLEAAARNLKGASPSATGHLSLAQDFVCRSQEDIRRSVWDLRAEALETTHLPAALAGLARHFNEGEAVRVDLRIEGSPRHLPDALESDLLRICQEAITNARKHGRARHITVTLLFRSEAVSLRVEDNGEGFAGRPEKVGSEGHFGILGMRERMNRHGGAVQLNSPSCGGAVVHVSVPFNENNLIEPEQNSNSPRG